MTTVAFIGLGIMGGPMAANLVKAGFEVVGYNRSPEPVQRLVDAGGRGADSVADAVREADVIITMVPDSPDVEAVTGGDDGIFANAAQGALYVDMSTIRPDVAVRVAEAGRKAGLRVLDAPVSGGEAGAIEAQPVDHGRRRGRRLRGREARARGRRQDDRARRARGLRADRQGREPAHRRRQHRAARRGGRVPRGVRRGHEGRAGGARRRPGRQHRAEPQGRRHARPRVQARLPARPAPQGHGHRHLRRPRGRRGDPARRGRRPAHRPPWSPAATAASTTPAC